MVSATLPDSEMRSSEPSLFERKKTDFTGWIISVCLHLAALFLLATITRISFVDSDDHLVTVVPEQVTQELETIQTETKTELTVGNQGSLNEVGESQHLSTVASQIPVNELKIEVEQATSNFKIPVQTTTVELPESNVLAEVNATGSTDTPAGGVQGAVDRITFEIANSLKEKKTVVVWLFDASLSLKKRRDEISNRFQTIYEQLGQLNATKDNALLTSIVTFGNETKFITPKPIDDIPKLIELTKNIEPDESGVEKVFSATSTVIEEYKKYRKKNNGRRKIMIIIVTDERGDDIDLLEATIERAQRNSIPIFCIGDGAVLGREKGYVNWEFSDGTSEYLPVDQGPESIAPERLQLPFWGSNAWRMEAVSSGFGPYGLTRLCRESGGMYFISTHNHSKTFELESLRHYQPDYTSISRYKNTINSNQAMVSLVKASMIDRIKEMPQPILAFRADTEQRLRTAITEAQKPLAVLDYGLQEMLSELERGVKARDQVTSPRWQAGFDLAMGRVLAMHVRAYGYNSLLAEMKVSPKPFTNKENNTWTLMPSRNISGQQKIVKMAEQAEMFLRRVIHDHPETPWAFLAEQELQTPMGWEWRDVSRVYPPEPKTPEERKQLLLAQEAERQRMEQKKKARGPQPKL